MAQGDTIFTQTLSSSNVPSVGGKNIFSITVNNGIRGLGLIWVSGTVLMKGTKNINGLSSDWIALTDGAPFGFSLNLAGCQFDIDVTNGICEIGATE